ncbi:TPA: EF-Tu/IF-2/RF-3 family GTPase, partial [Neisseria gonorrhoeae]
EIQDMIGIDASDAIMISAKTGLNIDKVIDAIINKIPAPKEADTNKPLQALIFDSYFDNYRGVVIYVRLFDGKVKVGDEIYFMQTEKHYLVTELGVKNPNEVQKNELQAGEVG